MRPGGTARQHRARPAGRRGRAVRRARRRAPGGRADWTCTRASRARPTTGSATSTPSSSPRTSRAVPGWRCSTRCGRCSRTSGRSRRVPCRGTAGGTVIAGLVTARTVALEDLDFTRIARPGDTVLWSPGAAEPVPLVERLLAQRHRIGPFTRCCSPAPATPTSRGRNTPTPSASSPGALSGAAGCSATAAPRKCSRCTCRSSAGWWPSGALPVDVVIAQFAVNDRGEPSHGVASSIVGAAARRARTVVAELNDAAPWTHSRHPPGRVDLAVRTSRPLVEVARRAADRDRRADRHAGRRADRERATVQLGIGGVPIGGRPAR